MRSVGEVIESDVPLSDPMLHLKDGTLLTYTSIYRDYISFMESFVETSTDRITASQRITISESHAVEFKIGPGTPGTYASVNFIQPNGDAKTVTQPSAIDCTNFSNGLHDFMLYANN